jgi:hypothetical protein
MDSSKQRNLIMAGVIVFLLVIIGVWFFTNKVKPTTTSYNLQYSPKDATVLLDGQPVKAGTIKVKNGTHTLTGTRQYFTKATREIDTNNDLPGRTIYLILGADTPEAQKYLADHPEESDLREGASDTQVTIDNDKLITAYPYIQFLPHETLDYEINYHTNKDLTIGIDVTLKPTTNPADKESYKSELLDYQQEAKDYMNQQSIDTSKVTVTWSPDPAKL